MSDSQNQLSGSVAIVTGAARRLGRAIACQLAAHGADIVIHHGDSAEAAAETADQIRSLGRRVALVSANLRDATTAATKILAAADELGGADILVNNAAIFEDAPPGQTSEELYDRHLTINLKAPFFLSQEFAARLPTTGSGKILNLVDWRAARPPGDYLAYSVSKAGLLALTKGLALQMAPRIRVNAIAPGAILPPSGADFDAWQAIKSPAIPLVETGSPQDIVEAALYLLSSRFITGEVLYVTGGEELW